MMLSGTNLKYTKAYNFRIVLETIRLYGPLSRADIARRTDLTPQTVSNITRKLIEADLIQEGRRIQEGRGAPAIALELNPEGAFAIGLDLDQDHLTGILLDLGGNVHQRIYHELNFPAPNAAIDLMVTTAHDLIKQQGLTPKQVWGVGVGLPGPLGVSEGNVSASVVNPKAFPGWKDVPVVDILNERLNLPIYLENNATASAVGERWYGAGRHIRTFFYVFLGVGLGGGLIIDGHPYEGHMGNAGELGYTPVVGGKIDESALFKKPHLGVYFNLPRLYKLLAKQGIYIAKPTALEALYEERNPHLIEWLDTGVQHLAPLILSIEYLLDPSAIFFGGRWPNTLIRTLMDRLEAALPSLRIEGKRFTPPLLLATSGADAAALGVATLPIYDSFAPAPRILIKRNGQGQDATFAPSQHLNA